jgi:bile acid:Na+ symporter, BASS family
LVELLPLLLKLIVIGLVFSIGASSSFSDLLYLWRRPGLLLRSLLGMYVLVPLVAVILVAVVPLGAIAKATLLVLAVSGGAPLLPRKLGRLGSDAYVFSLVVTSSLLAIVLVPAWLNLLGRHFGIAGNVTSLRAAKVIGMAFLLPLALGLLTRVIAPAVCARFAPRLLSVLTGALLVLALVLIASRFPLMLQLHWIDVAALVGLLLAALAIGHALGGPIAGDRTALAIACATRHVGLAVLVAVTMPGPFAVMLVATYLLTTAAVTIPYLVWRRRCAAKAGAASAGEAAVQRQSRNP